MKKLFLIGFVICLIIFAKTSGYLDYLNFETLKTHQIQLHNYFEQDPWKMGLYFVLIYTVVTALSIPGAAVLTLAAGSIFGLFWGSIVVSFASSIGSTLAFLLARYLFRDFIHERFKKKIDSINKGIQDKGGWYLLTLRLIPAVPFFIVNLGMGLTRMNVLTFYLVSQLGMLPGTIIYVNAGTQLGKLKSPDEIFDFKIIGSFFALAVFPILLKALINLFKRHKLYKKFKKPDSFDYNLVVIGGGSAGLVASYIGAAIKSKVALIEKNKMGGDCLNTGCVPSKALIKMSKLAYLGGKVDFSSSMSHVKDSILKIAPHDSIERYRKLGVECFIGEAEVISPWEVKVNGQRLTTRNIILATGAIPVVPDIPGLEAISYKTSENLWNLKELPPKLLVLGGGNIGCELAQAFSRLGSQVTIVEKGDRLLSKEDSDVSEFILKKFLAEGIQILLNYDTKSFKKVDESQVLIASYEGQEREIYFEELLIAVSRAGRLDTKGLKDLGIETANKKTFDHDDFLRTKYPNIYVCGDCAGPYQFTHMASHQAWYATVNALMSPFKSFKVDYSVVPWSTFTDPEIAHVGLSEEEAKKQQVKYEVTKFDFADLDRAIIENEAQGFIKVLTIPGKDKILGATIVGSRAGDLLIEYTLAMKYNLGLNKLLSTIHPYPTFSESAKSIAGIWKRNHQPEKLLKYAKKFHTWRRN
ncbi:MAG TPA: FAD-dependent oxidoreductase [Bacteriovoracaceae bacterium]|nr:FAD-dependent oxidoreductase [Bacteriovoracaceae bacterium]